MDAAIEAISSKIRASNCSYEIARLASSMEGLVRARGHDQAQALKRSEALVEQLLEENRRLWELVQDEYRHLSGYDRVPTTRAERAQGFGVWSDNTPERALAVLESKPARRARAGEFEPVHLLEDP